MYSREGGDNMLIHRTEGIVSNQSKISSLLSGDLRSAEGVLPSFLLDLSDMSMKNVRDAEFEPRAVSILETGIDDSEHGDIPIIAELDTVSLKPLRIFPKPTETTLAAVDVSNIKVGETESGILCALRGAIVWKVNGSYLYLRCGPITFHIGNNSREIMNRRLGLTNVPAYGLNDTLASRTINRLRNTMERWIQRQLCMSSNNCVILFDGSLTAGMPDNPERQLKEVLELARSNGNVVVALSKDTNLILGEKKIVSLLDDYEFPCIIDIDDSITSQLPRSPMRLMGRIFVVKLSANGFSFRLDVDRKVPIQHGTEALCHIAGNDLVDHGYPETLRLAHILSAFTANEVIGIQRYAARTHGMRICSEPSVRRQLFGPFASARDSV